MNRVMDHPTSDTLEPNAMPPMFQDTQTPVLVELTRAIAGGANCQWWHVLGKAYRQSICKAHDKVERAASARR